MGSDLAFVPYGGGNFVKVIEDGIEYYTEALTGVCGMSHIGLARFVGASQPAITYWVKRIGSADPINNSLPKCLKLFAGKPLTLINKSDPGGSEILPDVVCSAMVAYYAMFAAPLDQTNEAKIALMTFGGIGMRSFIQSKTGWSKDSVPVQQTLSLEQELQIKKLDIQLTKLQIKKAKIELAAKLGIDEKGVISRKRRSQSSKDLHLWSGRELHPNQEAVDLVLSTFAGGLALTASDVAIATSSSNGYTRKLLVYLHRIGKVSRQKLKGCRYSTFVYRLATDR